MFQRIKSRIVVNEKPTKPQQTPKIIAIGSGKGGVGKSTVTTQLAFELHKLGFAVGLIDADIYGPSQPRLLANQQAKAEMDSNNKIIPLSSNGIKFISITPLINKKGPIILRAPMVTGLVQQFLTQVSWGPLDYLLIDLPPGTGDIQLTVAQQVQIDGAIVVTTPQEVAVHIAEKGLQLFQKVNVPILGIVENMAGFECPNCHIITDVFHPSGGVEKLCNTYDVPLLAQIPLHVNIAKASEEGKAVEIPTDNFHKLAMNVQHQLEKLLSIRAEPLIQVQAKHLDIAWDNKRHYLDAFLLRKACRCANCISEATGERLINDVDIDSNVTIQQVEKVGRYGIKIDFSDGHNTGIYTYEKLKSLIGVTV